METQHHQQDHQDLGNKNSSNSSSYLCRQSSSRWTPTSDQIRILKELYYNNGIRSPTADQIQRIAARLRHYGKIEGKNVFYWFQNHKARERQKKRFTPTAPPPPPPPPPPQQPPSTTTTTVLQSPFSNHFYHQQYHKLYTISTPEAGSSSSSFMPVACGYGSLAVEKSFRECSISPGEIRVSGITSHNYAVDSYYYNKTKPEYEIPAEEEEEGGGGGDLSAQIETLPLFPIHGGSTTIDSTGGRHDMFNMEEESLSEERSNGGGYYTGGNWFRSDGRTSLELSLNSYGYYYN